MNSSSLTFFNNLSEFEINQTLGVGEDKKSGSLGKFFRHTSGSTATEYKITRGHQELLGLAQEIKTESFLPFWVRNSYAPKRRSIQMVIKDSNDKTILYVKRPMHILTSTTIVANNECEILAYIYERFDPFNRNYELRSRENRLVAFVKAPIIKPWTFPVLNLRKEEIGLIKKKWPNVGEYLTYRETLSIKYNTTSLEEKIMIFATALALSIDVFKPKGY